jgi:hypothetical protein
MRLCGQPWKSDFALESVVGNTVKCGPVIVPMREPVKLENQPQIGLGWLGEMPPGDRAVLRADHVSADWDMQIGELHRDQP